MQVSLEEASLTAFHIISVLPMIINLKKYSVVVQLVAPLLLLVYQDSLDIATAVGMVSQTPLGITNRVMQPTLGLAKRVIRTLWKNLTFNISK